jgi:hypothetical protein
MTAIRDVRGSIIVEIEIVSTTPGEKTTDITLKEGTRGGIGVHPKAMTDTIARAMCHPLTIDTGIQGEMPPTTIKGATDFIKSHGVGQETTTEGIRDLIDPIQIVLTLTSDKGTDMVAE